MTFRGGIALPEPTHVGFVKREKFQYFPRSAGKYSCDRVNGAIHLRWPQRGGPIKFPSRNETPGVCKSLLPIGIQQAKGNLHAGTSNVPWRAPEAASCADRKSQRQTLNFVNVGGERWSFVSESRVAAEDDFEFGTYSRTTGRAKCGPGDYIAGGLCE